MVTLRSLGELVKTDGTVTLLDGIETFLSLFTDHLSLAYLEEQRKLEYSPHTPTHR
jgi:hypothetical protein